MLLLSSIAAPDLAQFDLRGAAIVVGIELAAGAALALLVYFFALPMNRRVARTLAPVPEVSVRAEAPARAVATSLFLAIVAAILAYNGWLISSGVDVRRYTLARLESFTADTWPALLLAFGQIALASFALLVGTRAVHRLVAALRRAASSHVAFKDRNLEKLFTGLDRAIVNTARLLTVTFVCWLLKVPEAVLATLLLVVRVYVIVSGGLLLIRGI